MKMDCQELIVRLNCIVLLESGDDIDTGWLGMGTKLSYVQGGQGYVRMGNFGFLGGWSAIGIGIACIYATDSPTSFHLKLYP